MRGCLFSILLLMAFSSRSQTLGGSSVFNFVNLPNTPQLTALGGINISQQTNDAGMAFNNPALLRKEMHTQMNAAFNIFYAGIRNIQLQQVIHSDKLNTSFAAGINYFNYGEITQTDAAGNALGYFRPNDFVLQLSAARSYGEKWHYGITAKFIQSNYGLYRSNAIAFDAGLTYTDTIHLFQAALLLKNMGGQIKAYEMTEKDELPFDVQLGISKRLKNAPLQFSLTAHHLHDWNLLYQDSVFNNNTGISAKQKGKFSFENIFSHFVLSVQGYIADRVEWSLGYNYLRRQELKIATAGNGLNGFSLGLGVLLPKLQIRYARAYYQNNTAYNQLGLNLKLNDYFAGLRK